MSAETEEKYICSIEPSWKRCLGHDEPEFISTLHRFLGDWYGDDWYTRWSVDDGYIEVRMFVPSPPSLGNTGYTIQGDSNECFS
jgi:hypothetical protein